MDKREQLTQVLKEATKNGGDSFTNAALATIENFGSVAEVDETYGDGLPYDYTRVARAALRAKQGIEDNLVLLGDALILIKTHEPEGTFARFYEENLGLKRAFVYYAMGIARAFHTNPTFRREYAHLPRSKQRALLAIPPDQFDSFAEAVPGDKAEKMSVRELKATIDELTKKVQEKGRSNANLNEENLHLKRLLGSLASWEDEAIIEDMNRRFSQVAQLLGEAGNFAEVVKDPKRDPRAKAAYLALLFNVKHLAEIHLEHFRTELTPADLEELCSGQQRRRVLDSFFVGNAQAVEPE